MIGMASGGDLAGGIVGNGVCKGNNMGINNIYNVFSFSFSNSQSRHP